MGQTIYPSDQDICFLGNLPPWGITITQSHHNNSVMVQTSAQGKEQIVCPIAAKLGDSVLEDAESKYGSWLET